MKSPAAPTIHATLAETRWIPARERRPGRVSVVIPSYNHAAYVRQAVHSVAMQSHRDIQLVVVDDGSSDASVSIVAEALRAVPDSVFEVHEHAGIAATMNHGLELTDGEFVCFLDSDDYFHPSRIERLLDSLTAQDAEMAFAEMAHISEDGAPHRDSNVDSYETWLNDVDTLPSLGFSLLRCNYATNLMVSAVLVERVGLFDRSLPRATDWDFVLRCLMETEPILVRQRLAFHRVHPRNSLYASTYTLQDGLDEYAQLMSRYLRTVDEAVTPNKLAPGPHAWPDVFEQFIAADSFLVDRHSSYPRLDDLWRTCRTLDSDRLVPPASLITYVGSSSEQNFHAVGQEFRISAILAGLRPDHDVLDVGCGSGRLALALTDYLTGGYAGFDVSREAIEWCRAHITPDYPNFRFDHADVHHALYQPDGSEPAETYTFPYPDASFDFVVAASVFTHLAPDVTSRYMAEIARVLRPGGRCLMTFFLETADSRAAIEAGTVQIPFPFDRGTHRILREDEPDWAVCHPIDAVRALLRRTGLNQVGDVRFGKWADPESQHSLQDLVVVERSTDADDPAATGFQIVCVSHRPQMFDEYVGTNPFSNRHQIHRYDNSVENLPLPVRYNQFIDYEMDDGWVAFIHHDFAFHEDPMDLLSTLPKDRIYGVIGTTLVTKGNYFFLGMPGKSDVRVKRGRIRSVETRGLVKCVTALDARGFCGEQVEEPVRVDTVDCCCLIVHSSLIREHNLRFDEQFGWHLYSEEFSLTAKQEHGVETWVAPILAGHYGYGLSDGGFQAAIDALINKLGNTEWATTCFQPPEATEFAEIAKRKGVMLVW
jgi:SAM-dependent methyltransferase